jgi:hypothetical protein
MKSIYPWLNILLILTILVFTLPFANAGGGSCFLPGTLITMSNGSQIPIENVKAGDKIISNDENLNPVVAEVLETEAPVRDDYYIISFENNKQLKITNEHPLYVKSGNYKGWGSIEPEATINDAGIKAKKIKTGDYVLNIEKKWIKITNIKHVNEKVQTYNLKKVDKTNTFFAEGFLAHNKGGKNPPPPPPQCKVKKAGCYKTGDVKADFGSLSPSEFRYFLPEDLCISNSGCTCGSVSSDVTADNSPDSSSGACNCIAGTDWNDKAKCCGKSADDCGKVKSGILCSIDANGESARWISSVPNIGDVRFVGCTGSEFLSDGANWVKCDGTFWQKTVGNSQYMCIGKGRESIVECCGDGTCKSKIDGKRLTTGQSVNPDKFRNEEAPPPATPTPPRTESTTKNCKTISKEGCIPPITTCDGESFTSDQCTSRTIIKTVFDAICACPKPQQSTVFDCKKEVCTTITGSVVAAPKNQITANAVATGDSKTYYCMPDRKFDSDLDLRGSQASDKTLIVKYKTTCEKAGFKWTGTKCCSEDDDPGENYNDAGGNGGCIDKKPVISVSFVKGTDDSIINFNGEFHGCAVDKSNFNKNNDNLLSLTDKHTGAPLVTNHNYCFNDPESNFFCSFTEKWLPTDGTDKTHISFAPIANPKQAADCCAANECWNGEQCIESQKDDPLAQPTGANSRCIDGEWTESELRSTIDDGASGFCPKKTQCLANVFGKEEQTQCLESGEYFDDNLCENGIWSTRTKLLALKLLDLKSGDFTLFCDDKENTLNNIQYITDSNAAASNILSGLKSNNFCVLQTGSRIIAATSINKNLSEIPAGSLNIFGVTSCSDAFADDGQYHPCDSTSRVWFNKRLKSFIYSSNSITIPSDSPGKFDELIGNPVRNIIESIKRLISIPPFDESYLKGIKKFDKLYMFQHGSKSIRGHIEGTNFKNAVIEYRGFEADICKFIGQFSLAKKDVSSGISCQKEGSNYYVLSQGSKFTTINPESIWPDLTSKLRVK